MRHGIGTMAMDGGEPKYAVFYHGEVRVAGIKSGFSGYEFNNLLDGEETIEYENGSKYRGDWLECKYHGVGEFTDYKNDVYTG
jgi:hypothetical protein